MSNPVLDENTYMMSRCQDCGHWLRFPASHCPQCGVVASEYEPDIWPEICDCERCEIVRVAVSDERERIMNLCPWCHGKQHVGRFYEIEECETCSWITASPKGASSGEIKMINKWKKRSV